MKLLAIPFLTVLLSTDISASDATALRKVEDKLRMLDQETMPVSAAATSIQWSVLDERESAFWSAVTEAYDFLMARNQTVRHQFLYGAAVAAQSGHPARLDALNTWLKKENNRVYALGLPYAFYDVWKEKMLKLNEAVTALGAARPSPAVNQSVTGSTPEMREFLSGLRADLRASVTARSNPKASEGPQSSNSTTTMVVVATALLSLAAGLLYPRKKKYIKVRTKEPQGATSVAEELPPLPVLDEAPITLDPRSSAFAVNVEDQCRKVLEDNKHLLRVANLRLEPALRSPFRTTVNIPEEKVTEALHWLLKGTLAIANSTKAQASHFAWSCQEQQGRVSLEFVLHGLECDQKALYMNTIIDQTESATAHFGRTERTLEGHLPVVGYRIGGHKTTISLGLDAAGAINQ